MRQAFSGVGPLLAGMVAKGLVTVEQLDVPTPRWMAEYDLMAQYRAMAGKPTPEWQNPARQWIEAHPGDWQALQNLHADAKASREEYRRSRSGLGWSADALRKVATVEAPAATGWDDSDELVEFGP